MSGVLHRQSSRHAGTAARRWSTGLLTLALLGPAPAAAQPDEPLLRWFKGNTHTHTLESDGDSTPDEVARWYFDHGYHFVVLTDHNVLTGVDALNARYGVADRFLVMKGEEVTDRFGDKPVHVNGLDVGQVIPPPGGASVLEMLQRSVDAIRREQGVPHINHPNYGWAISADDLGALRDTRLFEVFSGHPQVNQQGGGGVPALDEVWDALLTRGVLLYGIAVDDAHVFKEPDTRNLPGPGRGWVMVRAARLEARAVLQALERGDFYASTGVELADYESTAERITLTVKAAGLSKYRVQFIGREGRVLEEVVTPTATYRIRGDEGYVRAKVFESNGRLAWTQPRMVPPRSRGGADALILFVVAVAAVGARWLGSRGRGYAAPPTINAVAASAAATPAACVDERRSPSTARASSTVLAG